jgi:hypothetical protein
MMMNDDLNETWRAALKTTLTTLAALDEAPGALDRDLWPRMQQRLATPVPSPSRWDWALLAATVAAACVFPQIMLGLLYHL